MTNPLYPVFLDLSGHPVLVVGAGRVAARRIPELLQCGARVTVVSPRAVEAVTRLSTAITWLEREYAPGDEQGFHLVFALTDDSEINEAVAACCSRSGIPCNAAHSSLAGSFHVPGVHRQGDVTVAVGTGGKAPGLTRHLRREIARLLGTRLGDFARILGEIRIEARKRMGAIELQRHFASLPYGRLLAEFQSEGETFLRNTLLARLVGKSGDQAISPPPDTAAIPPVLLVGAGPGNPGLMTLLAKEAVEKADVIIHDRLIPTETLAWAPAGCMIIEVGKRGHFESARQEEIEAQLVEHARLGRRVVRLKGGDPFVFGRGWEEILALEKAGIPWQVLPGLSSTTAAPTWAGIPLTTRGLARSYAVMSGMAYSQVNVEIPKADTIVVLMGLQKLDEIVAAFLANGWKPSTPAAAVQDGTTTDQKLCFSTLESLAGELARQGFDSPTLIVVGQVVDLARKSKARRKG